MESPWLHADTTDNAWIGLCSV